MVLRRSWFALHPTGLLICSLPSIPPNRRPLPAGETLALASSLTVDGSCGGESAEDVDDDKEHGYEHHPPPEDRAPESYPGTADQIVRAPDDEHHHKHEEQGARYLSQCLRYVFVPFLPSERRSP